MARKDLIVGCPGAPSRRRAGRYACVVAVLTLTTLFTIDLAAQQQPQSPQLIGGRNVSMAGGSQILRINPYEVRGDVLGRAQNEPSCAISTRNPQHVLCGANDYRLVDVPGVTQTQLIRDAWLGVFQSANGGDKWESTLLGGFYLDPTPHPLKTLKFQAGADPVVRSGLAGVTFYTGIAFTGDKSRSALHVTTYLDLNNSEQDDMPFKPVRTTVVHQVRAPQFIDKPWMYVEAGPAGQTCTLPVPNTLPPAGTPLANLYTQWQQMFPNWQPKAYETQVVPASTVHIVYTVFLDANDSTAAIMYTRSTNCGQTFSTPLRLNPTAVASVGLNDHGNGAAVAKPLASGAQTVVTTWRRVRQTIAGSTIPDALVASVSRNNGTTWSQPLIIEQICPFDQGTTSTSFRTTAFPSITADANGRFYVAWSDRRKPDGTCDFTGSSPDGASRIRIATSPDGFSWSSSIAVPSTTPEHQIQPTLTFNAGRLFLAWLDFRDDASQLFRQFINESDVFANLPPIRHTADVRASMALPGSSPDFASGVTLISEYLKGVFNVGGRRVVGQLQWNAVNRRWARKGTVPFYGDYIDIATMPYLSPDPSIGRMTWEPNNRATIQSKLNGVAVTVPVMPNLLIAWADNRDMRAAPGVDNNSSTPVPFTTPANLNLPSTSIYDPTQMRPICTPGSAYTTGTTNQNAYSSRISIGFVAAAPGNNKDLGTLQRAFVVYVRNDSSVLKTFTLSTTPPPGGFASFDQFDPTLLQRSVNVPARSSVARTVYVTRDPASSTPLNPDTPVRVDVIELAGTIPVTAATVMLNADPSAPEIDSPEIDSREIFTPEIDSPEIDSLGFASPEIDSPEIDSPEIDSATWRALGLGFPEIDSPEIDSPEIDSPEIDSPEIDSPEIDSAAITDAKFRVRNLGNTTGEYNARAFVTPTPGTDFRYQVIVRKTYSVPAVDGNCQATTIALSKVAVNIKDTSLGTPEIDSPEIDSPEIDSSAPGTASFYLAPGETAQVIVRTRSASGQTPPATAFSLATQQAAVNSDEAAQGVTSPPVITTFLSVGTTAVPAGQPGTAYNTQLVSSGGVGTVIWTLTQGALPAGLALTAAGQIVGTPTAGGTFPFTVQVTDSAVPIQTATRSFTLIVTTPGVAVLAFINQPTTTVVGATMTPNPSVRAFDANGAPAIGVPVTVQLVGTTGLQGTVTRTTGSTGVVAFNNLSITSLASGLTLTATAPGFTGTSSTSFATVLSPSPTLAFNVQPSNVSVDAVMTPAVEVRVLDTTGAPLPGVSVSLQLVGAGNLSGTLTRIAGATGIATFNDLVMTTSGTGLALRAVAAGYLTAVSTKFDAVTTTVHSPVAGSGVSTEPLIARPVQGLGGDANRDLVVVHSNGLVTRMSGSGTGQFSLMFQAPVAGMTGAPRDLKTGIVDGDGNADIVVAYDGADTNNLAILSSDGNFGLSQNQTYTVSIPGVPGAALVGQLNAAVDGVPDVAVVSRTTNQLLISETNQNFALRPAIPLPGSEPIAIASGQMNAGTDPWLDLVVLNRGSRNVTVLLGDGQGGFTSAGNFPLGAAGLRTPSDSPDALALADFNEDGRLDVVVATDAPAANEGQAVIVLTGNGQGGLSTGARHSLSAGPFGITTGDFDNDGHIDVASANPVDNNVTVVFGTGTGSFSLPQVLNAGNTPRGIVASDVTNDGRPDLVVTNRLQRPQSSTDEVTTIVNSAAGNGALTVTNTADSGPGSLRQAIISANARAGLDEISFAIPGAGAHVIALNTQLPHITDPIVIDGSTQPGYAGVPRVEIDGSAVGADADGLWIEKGYSDIIGLSLTGFLPGPMNIGGSAIVLAAPAGGSLVRANHIGLHASGAPIGAPTVGWGVTSGGANLIGLFGPSGRNVISGTSFTGVITGGTGATVMYNRFGTTPDGLASALPGQAQGTGVTVTGSNVLVWRNVIANQGGVYLNATATNVRVQDNHIGTDETGNVVLANQNFNSVGVLVDGSNNLIGGNAQGEGNIIGGFGTGVFTRFGTGSVVLNNRIGVGRNGTSNLPNVWGIGLASGGNVVHNNTITASSQAGVMLTGISAQNNLITNNTITQNAGVGIGLITTAGSGNNLTPNVFSQNGGLSIDLNFGDGPTANDAGDGDAGPNDLQNFPVITGAAASGGNTIVSGALNSTASSTFIVSVFQNTGACPAPGRGEGQALLGSFAVVTDAAGNAPFSVGLVGNVPVGAYLSATATDGAGSTSEISPCFPVSAGPGGASLSFTVQPTNTAVGQTITPGVTVLATDATSSPAPNVAVTIALTGTGTLSGTLTQNTAANGTAVFNNLSINATGTGNTLTASAVGFLPATSTTFDITAAPQPPIANGLVGWWRAENNALDSAGSNDGTLVNGTTFAPGMFGQAFSLDGVDDLVDVGPGFNLDALTLSAWVFIDPATNTGNHAVISKDDETFVSSANRQAFALMSTINWATLSHNRPAFVVIKGSPTNPNTPGVIDVIEAPSQLTAGWHHLVGVRDQANGRFELYIDGTLVGTTTPTVVGPIVSSVNISTTIGAANASPINHFAGLIDEPQIFDRALTAAEVSAIYNHQSLVVTNTNDSGAGSLRDAIIAANAVAGPQVPHITFNILGAGPHTIAPTSPLPTIIRPVVIDGSSQSGNRVVAIDGTAAGATANGLVITGGGSSVRGLAIGGFGGNGIVLQTGGGNQIAGNFLGTNLTGTAPSDIGGNVILIQDSAANLIGGTAGTSPGGQCTGDCNLIVPRGNNTSGVRIDGTGATSANNRVLGNFIGVNALGTEGLGGISTFGVTAANGPSASIGDGTPAGRNVISGLNSGVLLTTSLASVTGNYIGTNSAGTAVPANTAGGFNNINFGITLAGADRATLVGNVVSGNGSGIALSGLGAQNNVVRGNYIGTNAAGTAPVPNLNYGVLIFNQSQNNIVGGTTSADRNVISGNGKDGVNLSFDPLVANNKIIGNYIGTNAAGTAAIGNGNAGVLVDGSTNTTIGGSGPGDGNIISGNTGPGVTIQGTATGNSVVANAIFNNGGLGIDLGSDGVTPNDALDADGGPNNFQNFPVVTTATVDTVSGTLHSTPNGSFTVHVFVNNTCDATGFGEGQVHIATLGVGTNASGDGSFSQSGLTIPQGQFVTATATDASGNTSEFAACVPVASALPVVTLSATDPNASEVGPDSGTFTFTRTGPTTSPLDVHYSISSITGISGTDYTPALTGIVTIPSGQTSATITITPVLDALVEGTEDITFTLVARPDYTIGSPAAGTVTIADAPVAAVVTVVATDASAAEAGPDPGSFTFTRTGSTAAPLNVNFTLGGTATPDVDYINTIGTLVTIPVGQASATVSFTPILDAIVEPVETVSVTLTAGSYTIGNPGGATATIAENTPTVTVAASDPSAAEAGPDPGTFTFTRTGPTVAALSVTFTIGGTATGGLDYSTIGTLVTIPVGQSSITLNVNPLPDALFEGPETVTATITPGTYVIGVSNAATITIADANPPVVTTFTVSNTNDGGPGSLRQAILDANVFGTVTDNIFFNIPGAGVHTISPNSPLPPVTQSVVIDARTQPGYAGTPLIELSGAQAGVNADGLVITSGASWVSGLAINRWARAIVINGQANNTITANFIGTDPTGTIALANSGTGAIHIIDSSGNVIGGNNLVAGNLISGNSSNGVRIDGALSSSNFIEFNRIGVSTAGTALGNGISGVYIRTAPNTQVLGNIVRFNGLTSGVAGAVAVCGDNTTCPGASFGTQGNNASTTQISNNTITDNSNAGVWVHAAPNTSVGGGLGGNNISNNGFGPTPMATNGVLISGVGATANQVIGNAINNNAGAGVLIVGDGNTRNRVQGTTFVGNGGLAIDLGVSNNASLTGADGVTPNDAGDGDIGPNDRQNFPVITAALSGGLVQGTLNSTPNSGFVLEFFASAVCNAGSAQRILGTGGVATDGAGNGTFSIPLTSAPTASEFVTATATTSAGNTSELSGCVPVTVLPVVTITAPDPNAAEIGPDPASFTVTRTGSTTNALVVQYALSGTATNGVDYVTLPGTVTIPIGQTSATFTVDPIDDNLQEPVESVIVSVSPDAAYQIGSPGLAVASIAGDVNDTVLQVINTNDSGPGSLRQAMLDANAVNDLTIIFFQIPGTGPFTIQPTTPLPALTSPTYILATTQFGYTTTPVIELSGALAGPNADGLELAGGSSFVSGLAINRWSGRGVYIHGPGGNVLTQNFIGTDVTGTIDLGNAGIAGVHIEDSAGNGIGGGSLAAANLISGNDVNGVRIDGALATGNIVYYNQFGITPGGAALGNTISAVYVRAAPGTNIVGNVMRFNGGPGAISVCGDNPACPGPALGTPGSDASGTLIYSNVITDNLNSGVTIRNSPDNFVGFAGFANTISNNGVGGTAPVARVGIFVAGVGSTGNQIIGNVIDGNTQGGVLIIGTGNTGNIVQGNTYSGNGGLAIDLGVTDGTLAVGADGVTPNDAADGDAGPNNYQNFPVIALALSDGSVQGTLNSLPVNTFTLEFYASSTCTVGAAERILGSTFVGTDSNGDATFNFALTSAPNVGEFVRATATDVSGNTSELSACVQASPP